MTLLLFSALLAVAAGVYVVGPIVARRTAVVLDAAPGAVLDAEARRRQTLASLKELEYDFLGGKLDEADYRAQRDRLSHEALAALRAAEAISAPSTVDGGEGGDAVPAVRIAPVGEAHACGFVNPPASRFCAGCGKRL
ncbi:MAG TPA: zinc ribbon domain-containing protein [Longimicrobium sp.]|nr:zinc ribbon domain-containing protein [Longimicrobium sp.]